MNKNNKQESIGSAHIHVGSLAESSMAFHDLDNSCSYTFTLHFPINLALADMVNVLPVDMPKRNKYQLYWK